jgi:hypothetical protein
MAMDYNSLKAYIDGLYADGTLSLQDYNKIIMYILANGDLEKNPRDLIQIRRGNVENLPTLAQGELAVTLDEEKIYVGGLNGNIGMPTKKDMLLTASMYGATGDGSDSTVRLQTALDSAQGSLLYIGDGLYTLSDTLIVKDNTQLLLSPNAVLKQASGINKPLIVNEMFNNGNTRNKNISIVGGVWDFNTAENPLTTTVNSCAIIMHKVDGVTVRDIKVLNTSKYAVLIANATGISVDNVSFNTISDGVHLQGPISTAVINNVKGTTGDDMVSLTIGDYGQYELSRGDFDNIVISNIFPTNCLAGIKITGNSPYSFKSITIDTLIGSVNLQGVSIITDTDLTETVLGNLTIRNIKTKSATNSPSVTLYNVKTAQSVTIDNIVQMTPNARLIDFKGNTTPSAINTININNIVSDINTTTTSVNFDAGMTVENLTVSNSYINNADSVGLACIVAQGVFNNVTIDNVKFKFPLNNGYALYSQQQTGTTHIANLTVNNVRMIGGANFYEQNSDFGTLTRMFVSNSLIECKGSAFNVYSDTEFYFANTKFYGLDGVIVYCAGNHTFTLMGDINYDDRQIYGIASSATIYMRGLTLRGDVSQLAKRKGDFCYNTNAGLSCGEGLVVCDGTTWKNLFTGTTY